MRTDARDAGVRARVTSRFFGVKDGEVYPRWFSVGQVVAGDLAVAAIEAGQAEPIKTAENKALTAPEKKTGGLTGEAQRSSSQPAGQASKKRTSTRRKGAQKS